MKKEVSKSHTATSLLIILSLSIFALGYNISGYGWNGSPEFEFSNEAIHSVPPDWRAAFESAANTWNNAGAAFSFGNFRYNTLFNSWGEGSGDSKNGIYRDQWFPTSELGATRRFVTTNGNFLVETDIRINDHYDRWVTQCPSNSTDRDVETTALHELGHAIGLEHTQSNNSGAVMYEEYVGCRRSLTQDDIDGLIATYGTPCIGCDCYLNSIDALQSAPTAAIQVLSNYQSNSFETPGVNSEDIALRLRLLLNSNQSLAAEVNSFITNNHPFLAGQDDPIRPVITSAQITDATDLISMVADSSSSKEFKTYLSEVESSIQGTQGMNLEQALDHISSYLDKTSSSTSSVDALPDNNQDQAREGHLVAYPNPTSSTATLHYSLADPTHVQLTLFEATGRKLRSLTNRYMHEGVHSTQIDVSQLASGVYFARMRTDSRTEVAKVVVKR
jgi:hypothetical protein